MNRPDKRVPKARSHLFVAALVVLLVGVDQWSKVAITAYFDGSRKTQPDIPVFGGLFHLTYTTNTGAAFGVLAGDVVSVTLLAISVAALGFIGWYYWRYRQSAWMRIALAFIASGAVGNFTDRVRLRYVVDFIDVDIGSYQWPFFNVADSLICIGAGMLVLYLLATNGSARKETTDNAA